MPAARCRRSSSRRCGSRTPLITAKPMLLLYAMTFPPAPKMSPMLLSEAVRTTPGSGARSYPRRSCRCSCRDGLRKLSGEVADVDSGGGPRNDVRRTGRRAADEVVVGPHDPDADVAARDHGRSSRVRADQVPLDRVAPRALVDGHPRPAGDRAALIPRDDIPGAGGEAADRVAGAEDPNAADVVADRRSPGGVQPDHVATDLVRVALDGDPGEVVPGDEVPVAVAVPPTMLPVPNR